MSDYGLAADSVTIGYVHPNTVQEGFARSLAHACLWKPNNIIGIISASNPRQTVARNEVIKSFLEGPGEWLMWIDTDMTFHHEAIVQLRETALREQADMVTGLGFIYKRGANIIIPNGYMFDKDENAFTEIEDYKSDLTYEVDGTGSGFILIHREVFEAWPTVDGKPQWHRNWIQHPQTGQEMGHDLAFTYEATQNLGLKLVWDTAVKTGHIKHFELTEDNFRSYQETL